MEETPHEEIRKRLTLKPVQEGLKVGIKSDGTKYSVRDDRSRFFFPNEWIAFIEKIKPEKRILFETLIQTGARIEEALHIKPKHFDWTRNNLTLRVTKIKARKGETVGKARTLPVSSQYTRKVKAYINRNMIQDNQVLFPKTKQAVWQMLRRKLKGVVDDDWNFGLHNIRKTHGNWLKALEVPAEEICTRLGHDFNTYLKHYSSPNIFDRKDKMLMIKILGDVYGFK